MKKEKIMWYEVKHKTSMSQFLNLPEEIHYEIFLKLPAKSVLVSRCICKLVYNLLSKPSFIKNHVNLSIQSKTNPRLLFNHSSKGMHPIVYSVPIDYGSISSSSSSVVAVSINYPLRPKSFYYLDFLGSSNGLVCLKTYSGDKVDHKRGYNVETKFCILNPLTREFKEFSKPGSGYYIYGFGYDSNADDYKLVTLSCIKKIGCHKVDVYAMQSDSWSMIQGTVNYSSFNIGKGSHGLFFNGSLHWLGSITNQETLFEVIVSFDISKETVADMPLPENIVPPTGYQGQMYANVGVLEDKICVAFIWDSVRIDVWVMQKYGVKESWAKRFTMPQLPWPSHGLPFWKPLWCFDNGEFLIDNDTKQLVLYDPTDERVRPVLIYDIIMDNTGVSYVESIVSLNSGTYLEKRNNDGIAKNL